MFVEERVLGRRLSAPERRPNGDEARKEHSRIILGGQEEREREKTVNYRVFAI